MAPKLSVLGLASLLGLTTPGSTGSSAASVTTRSPAVVHYLPAAPAR